MKANLRALAALLLAQGGWPSCDHPLANSAPPAVIPTSIGPSVRDDEKLEASSPAGTAAIDHIAKAREALANHLNKALPLGISCRQTPAGPVSREIETASPT
jgi:hypothetical protein